MVVIRIVKPLSRSTPFSTRLERHCRPASQPGDDARVLLPHLDRLTLVEVTFPAFRDGRGYSSARILREAGYTRRRCARQGDVLVDQVPYMKRCGFDISRPNAPLDQAVVEKLSGLYPATTMSISVQCRWCGTRLETASWLTATPASLTASTRHSAIARPTPFA
jgi:uncharacterized protein (DUF934 family)